MTNVGVFFIKNHQIIILFPNLIYNKSKTVTNGGVVMSKESAKYNDIVLTKVERRFDMLFPFASLACFSTAFLIVFSTIPMAFAYINIFMGVSFIVIFIKREKLLIQTKIFITIAFALMIGTIAFTDGGYTSSFIILFALANIISVLFLSKKFSHRLGMFSSLLFLLLWGYNEVMLKQTIFYLSYERFAMQFLVFILYLLMLNVAVYSIKNSLNVSILKLEETLEKAHNIAYYDTLTGLANLVLFKEQLELLYPKFGSIVILNLKSLNIINSIFGEDIGDQVLIDFSSLLKEYLYEGGFIARHGGNEFVLYSILDDEESIKERLEEFIDFFNHSYVKAIADIDIQFYVTYSTIFEDYDCLEAYQNAKIAMTFAKKHGITAFLGYDQDLIEYLKREELIRVNVEPAIHQGEIVPYYQEKIDTVLNKVVGVEALARWELEDLGEVSPSTFITIIENMGLSVQFGEYMMDRILSDYKTLSVVYGDDISICINISPTHLISSNFTEKAIALKNAYQIPDKKIMFEITEEVLIEDMDKVKVIVAKLHEAGFLLSLDDFGSGYSSISYLAILDIDELKIDKSFIERVVHNIRSKIIIESLIVITKKYNVRLVAEGVETEEQLKILTDIGCRIIQGYYFSKPKSINKKAA